MQCAVVHPVLGVYCSVVKVPKILGSNELKYTKSKHCTVQCKLSIERSCTIGCYLNESNNNKGLCLDTTRTRTV